MRALLPTDGTPPLVALADVPEPAPASDEAIVAVDAFSINRGETFLLERPTEHWRPGKDVAGRVVRSAADGSGPPAGARVVGHPPRSGWAERVAVPTAKLAALPAELTAETAAALPLAGLTALRMLRVTGPLAGLRVLLTGASGGVGHYFTELASAAGAAITAVTAAPERGARLRELGATRVIQDLGDAGGPFDVVLESVGGRSLPRAFSLLRAGGSLIWFGQAGRQPAELDFPAHFPQSGATIRYFHYEDSDIPVTRDLDTLIRLVRSGRLHPELGRIADWRETAAVLDDLRERRIRGNAVLRVAA
jgi:NADPH2:quinone reductase